jgi:hypothetical protein
MTQNWTEIARKRLNSAKHALNDEIISELAAHLEDLYDDARSRGLTEAAALEFALQEMEKANDLAKKLHRVTSEEALVNYRTKSLWIPGMVTMLGASLSLMVLQKTGYRPHFVWKGGVPLMFYYRWLATLPFAGAAGAFLAQRACATTTRRLAVATSPALLLLIVISCIMLPSMVTDAYPLSRFIFFLMVAANWVGVPGVALLVGAAPFLRNAPNSRDELQPKHQS